MCAGVSGWSLNPKANQGWTERCNRIWLRQRVRQGKPSLSGAEFAHAWSLMGRNSKNRAAVSSTDTPCSMFDTRNS